MSLQPSAIIEKSKDDNKNIDFESVFNNFCIHMNSYRQFLSLTASLAPIFVSALMKTKVLEFATRHGNKVYEDEKNVEFELDIEHFRAFNENFSEIESSNQGAKHLPEIMITGLISVYDGFLNNLLKAIFIYNPDVIMTSEKSILYSDIKEFKSISEIIEHLINDEVESVLRLSHHEQFIWMEKKFGVHLRNGLECWGEFVEICERRNLLTHANGIVSNQYIQNCTKYNPKGKLSKIGEKLIVNNVYLSSSINIISEIGLKLCYVMWRKFIKLEQERIDGIFCEMCYNLIVSNQYKLAEILTKFGAETIEKFGGLDKHRRMFLVNRANALRLQKDIQGAKKVIDAEDWSSVGGNFTVCAVAAAGNRTELLAMMRSGEVSKHIRKAEFVHWPVFRGYRDDPEFIEEFERAYGEPLIAVYRDEQDIHESRETLSVDEKSLGN